VTQSTIRSQRAYTGRVISVDVDEVQFPDGSSGNLEMVRHSGASAVLPCLTDPLGDDPQLLLIKQFRYAAEQVLIEIPAGRLEPNEEPEACARRELREEVGCTATNLQRLTTFYTTPGFTDERIHLFVATGLTRGDTAHEADEFIETIVLRMSEALAMIERGEITDGKTIVALLFAAGFSLTR
jgi:ADP-ribose pyrophosphatase